MELALPQDVESLPNRPAVFLLWPRAGAPEIGRTNVLRNAQAQPR